MLHKKILNEELYQIKENDVYKKIISNNDINMFVKNSRNFF